MKLSRLFLALIFTVQIFAGVICASLQAQGAADVIHGRPLHVRHFSGTIVDARGMTVEYATVELRDPKTHRVLASTFADGKGFFSFDDKKYGKRVELRAVQKGFNATQYTAMLRPFGDEHIHMVLSAAA
jgi:hypothetical protein